MNDAAAADDLFRVLMGEKVEPRSVEVGKPLKYHVEVVGDRDGIQWEVLTGEFPKGLQLKDGNIIGVAEHTGVYTVEIGTTVLVNKTELVLAN